MIEKVRSFIQLFVLKTKLKQHDREKQISSLNSAKTVGIVCLVDLEDNWKIIQNVIKEFQEKGAKVEVMGIFYGNVKPLWFIETLNVTLCTEKELGISQIPSGMHISEFLASKFDLLINFSINEKFAPFYISALSNAKFKIGLDTKQNRNHFDMLLNINDVDIKEYKNCLMHYLSQINI